MKCPHCGHSVPADSKVCDKCGGSITDKGDHTSEDAAQQSALIGSHAPQHVGQSKQSQPIGAEEKKSSGGGVAYSPISNFYIALCRRSV